MNAEEVLARHQPVPPLPVFAVGVREARVTVSSQQRRAIHLLDALLAGGIVAPGSWIAVIGAGAAGLTAAARAARAGCHVVVLERDGELLSTFRGNDSRLLHPNLYSWPAPCWLDPEAGLPLLTWRAAKAGAVARTIEEAFRHEVAATGLIDVRKGVHVMWPWPPPRTGELVHVRWVEGGTVREELVAAIVLAVGFGREYRTGKTFPGYWDNDDAEQAAGPTRREWLIQGAGDGGLTDLLRLRLSSFDQAELFRDLLPDGDARVEELKEEVRRIEALPGDAEMDAAYRGLAASWLDNTLSRLPPRPHVVTLNDVRPPFGPRRFPLNKLIASRFLCPGGPGGVEWVEGELVVGDPLPDGRVEVAIGGKARVFDRVLLRRGGGRPLDSLCLPLKDGCDAMTKLASDAALFAPPRLPPPVTPARSLRALASAVQRHSSLVGLAESLLLYLRHAGRQAEDLAEEPDFHLLRDEALEALAVASNAAAFLSLAPEVTEAVRELLSRPHSAPDVVVRAITEAIDELFGSRLYADLRGPAGRSSATEVKSNLLHVRAASANDPLGRGCGGMAKLALRAANERVSLRIEWTHRAWPPKLRIATARIFSSADELILTGTHPNGHEFFGAQARDPAAHAQRLDALARAVAQERPDFLLLPEFAFHASPSWASATRHASGSAIIGGLGHNSSSGRKLHQRVAALRDTGPTLLPKSCASSYAYGEASWAEDIHTEVPVAVVAMSSDGRVSAFITGEDADEEVAAVALAVNPSVLLGIAGPVGPRLRAVFESFAARGCGCFVVGLASRLETPASVVHVKHLKLLG